MKMKKLITFLMIMLSANAFAKPLVQEGYFVFDQDKNLLKHLTSQYDLVIDHMSEFGYEVYGPQGLSIWLNKLGADFQSLNTNQKGIWDRRGGWPTHKVLTQQLKELAAKYPQIIKLFSIGKSVKGRDLWVVKISDNVNVDEPEPEFKYIANMHGDEIVGRDVMVKLIEDMAANYNKDPEITALVNNTEIFIMPTMNPDGSMKRTRANADWIDLNRDFPDFTTSDSRNTMEGRAVETQLVMKFQAAHHFALSANFHGGAVVVNYPWDTTEERHPLQNLIEEISLAYATPNPTMHSSYRFENGIVNGYDWYEVNGGMQDWSYYYYNDLQVTLEISQEKWPSYNQLDKFYQENRQSCLDYMEKIHQGGGFYLNDNSAGEVTIIDKNGNLPTLGPFTYWGGEFYSVLPNGEYTFKIVKESGEKIDLDVSVTHKDLHNHMVRL